MAKLVNGSAAATFCYWNGSDQVHTTREVRLSLSENTRLCDIPGKLEAQARTDNTVTKEGNVQWSSRSPSHIEVRINVRGSNVPSF